MEPKRTLLDDLEKVFSHYEHLCELYDYDCMKCKLCSLNCKKTNYNFLCDILCELILSMRKFY